MARVPQVANGRWTPPPARLKGEKILAARRAEEQRAIVELKQRAEKMAEEARQEQSLEDKLRELKEQIDQLTRDLPRILPGGGGGRRTIQKILHRDYELPPGGSIGDMRGSNNLDEITDAAEARGNLGLGTAATTDASDYATAAQGSKADTALQSADIGTSVQAQNAFLDALAGMTPGSEGQVIAFDSNGDPVPTSAGAGDMLESTYDPASLGLNVFNGMPVATRTALKALPSALFTSAYLTEQGREGQFIWRTGDFSAQIAADPLEAVYVKADDVATTAGAWVRQGSWIVDGLNLKWFGARGDNATDDTDAVDAAFALGSLLKTPVLVPEGTYLLNVDTAITTEFGPTWCSAYLRSNLKVYGIGKPTFKIKDGCSTDATPLNYNMFAGNDVYEDIHFEGIIFDLGGEGGENTISPERYDFWKITAFLNGSPGFVTAPGHTLSEGDKVVFGGTNTMPTGIVAGDEYFVRFPSGDNFGISTTASGSLLDIGIPPAGTYNVRQVGGYNPYNCAGILIAGTVASSGADARVDRMRVKDCGFINTPGVSCIVTGQGYAGHTHKSEDVVIEDCWFYNNGLDSYDHSSVNLWANNSKLLNCRFDHPTASQGVRGPVCAFELHGKGNQAKGNYVNNYLQGAYVCATSFGAVDNDLVKDNVFRVVWRGIATWSVDPVDNGLSDCLLNDNTIVILPEELISSRPVLPKAGIVITSDSNSIGPFTLDGNVMSSYDTQGSVAVLVYNTDAAGSVSALHVRNGSDRKSVV